MRRSASRRRRTPQSRTPRSSRRPGRRRPRAQRLSSAPQPTRRPLTLRAKVFYAALLLSALAGVALGVADSPAFRVKYIVLISPDRQLAEQIKPYVRDAAPRRVLLAGDSWTRELTSNFQKIKSVQVKRLLPDTLLVSIHPRRPVACVDLPGGGREFFVLDSEGVPFDSCPQPITPLVLLNFPAGKSAIPRPARRLEGLAGELYAQVVEGWKRSGLGKLTIDFRSPSGQVVAYAGGVKISLGLYDNLAYKLAVAGAIVRKLRAQGKQPVHIDLSVPARPTVRLKQGPAPGSQRAEAR